jgi:hypothetical protein
MELTKMSIVCEELKDTPKEKEEEDKEMAETLENMDLNDFIQTYYTCTGETFILKVIGPTMGYREFVVETRMYDIALDWVKHVEADLLKFMPAKVSQSIFGAMRYWKLSNSHTGNQIH